MSGYCIWRNILIDGAIWGKAFLLFSERGVFDSTTEKMKGRNLLSARKRSRGTVIVKLDYVWEFRELI